MYEPSLHDEKTERYKLEILRLEQQKVVWLTNYFITNNNAEQHKLEVLDPPLHPLWTGVPNKAPSLSLSLSLSCS